MPSTTVTANYAAPSPDLERLMFPSHRLYSSTGQEGFHVSVLNVPAAVYSAISPMDEISQLAKMATTNSRQDYVTQSRSLQMPLDEGTLIAMGRKFNNKQCIQAIKDHRENFFQLSRVQTAMFKAMLGESSPDNFFTQAADLLESGGVGTFGLVLVCGKSAILALRAIMSDATDAAADQWADLIGLVDIDQLSDKAVAWRNHGLSALYLCFQELRARRERYAASNIHALISTIEQTVRADRQGAVIAFEVSLLCLMNALRGGEVAAIKGMSKPWLKAYNNRLTELAFTHLVAFPYSRRLTDFWCETNPRRNTLTRIMSG